MITFEDFRKLELVAGEIVSAEDHPNAEKLQILKVDVGEEKPRTLVAALRGHYEPAALEGMLVVVVANLEPAKLRGVESQGMLLAAQDGETVSLMTPDKPVAPGAGVL